MSPWAALLFWKISALGQPLEKPGRETWAGKRKVAEKRKMNPGFVLKQKGKEKPEKKKTGKKKKHFINTVWSIRYR